MESVERKEAVTANNGADISKVYLLSICVPTYNRAKLLYSCLLSIFSQLDESLKNLVEVVVSNNHSTDETNEIINNFRSFANFNFYEQDENIGLARNVVDVVKKAKGEFCWIIGDDDFLLQGSVYSVVKLLQDNFEINYFYAKIRQMHVDEFSKYPSPFSTADLNDKVISGVDCFEVDKMEKLISPEYSIIFLGEIMVSIFRREIWLKYKGSFEGDFLQT